MDKAFSPFPRNGSSSLTIQFNQRLTPPDVIYCGDTYNPLIIPHYSAWAFKCEGAILLMQNAKAQSVQHNN